MPGERRLPRLKRLERIKQIQRMIVLGLTLEEMAKRLKVGMITVRRDIDWNYEQMIAHELQDVAVARSAIMSEIGQVYADCIRCERECDTVNPETHRSLRPKERRSEYTALRIRCLEIMTRLSGADRFTRDNKRATADRDIEGMKRAMTIEGGKLVIEYEPHGFDPTPHPEFIREIDNATDEAAE